MSTRKILILMRHAKPASDAGVEDFFIPLSKEGAKAQKKLCEKLLGEGFIPKKVFTSPFQRALETGDIVASYFQVECIVEKALGEPFNEEVCLKLLQSSEDVVAFIGHGPSLTALANTLLGKRLFKDILLKSSAALIAFEGEIKKGSGALLKYFF